MGWDRINIPVHKFEVVIGRGARVYVNISMDEEKVGTFEVIKAKENTKKATFMKE